MQYVLDIPNEKIAKKLLPMISRFKKDGVKIKPSDGILKEPDSSKNTDDYVKEHLSEFVYAESGDPLQDDDEVLKE